jgi:hypothetical protein
MDARQSGLSSANLQNGKFVAGALSESSFANTGIVLADKTVNIVELVTSSSDPKFKGTRTVLDALMSGGAYGQDPNNKKETDIGGQCSNLCDALNAYLSIYDARAMVWAFVTRYGDKMKKDECLGHRKSELAVVGLAVE